MQFLKEKSLLTRLEYPKKDIRFGEVFYKGMHRHTTLAVKDILNKYESFAGLKQIVDVGGGLGATLGSIVSKYPHRKGINYDLPHRILHDWSDEMCLKLLKNCWNALPESRKTIVLESPLIIVESKLPENPQDNDPISRIGFTIDMIAWTMNPGGKERMEKEFDALAKAAGFPAWKPICRAASNWVIEFYKNI
ncbi:hypothetical protein Vadar_022349 [Vaccinium darrowii]|uniref:Uncharacterized protein n=1 Tax=Vaccinium darrowii TaxID=229202 RepID=A0ACB7ZDI0_9ERIC|nr:hypothetical protein Vadar_022349 [Vaccinium darrowii]